MTTTDRRYIIPCNFQRTLYTDEAGTLHDDLGPMPPAFIEFVRNFLELEDSCELRIDYVLRVHDTPADQFGPREYDAEPELRRMHLLLARNVRVWIPAALEPIVWEHYLEVIQEECGA
jgi:hypothetical protein